MGRVQVIIFILPNFRLLLSLSPRKQNLTMSSPAIFHADAVLFDMVRSLLAIVRLELNVSFV